MFCTIQRVHRRVAQGSNAPFLATVNADSRLVSSLAVCKFPTSSPPKPTVSGFVEFLATRMAAMFGVDAPDCWLIRPAPEDSLDLEMLGIFAQDEFGFASEFQPDLATMSTGFAHQVCDFGSDVTEAGMSLWEALVFDVLFLNSDRTPDNPNTGLLMDGSPFFFDFGAGLFTPDTSKRSLEAGLTTSRISERAREHLCFEPLQMAGQRGFEFPDPEFVHLWVGQGLRDSRTLIADLQQNEQLMTSKVLQETLSLTDWYLNELQVLMPDFVPTLSYILSQ